MPYKPNVPCRHPGCSALVKPGDLYCEKHKAAHLDEVNRPSAASRGYGKRWQKASRAFLRAHPLCEHCLKDGRYVKATVVDHKTPHRGDQALFWNESNWQALCKPCHDKKTFTEDVRPEYKF
jgi:5-methylcytosine-specific restriction protein A